MQDTRNRFDSTDLHQLALELAGEWGLSENDMDMYFPPDQALTQPPMMIVAAANPTKERVVGVCLPVKGGELAEGILFSFGGAAQDYLIRYEHKDPMDVDISRVQIKLLAVTRQPEHGQLTMIKNDPYQAILYRPDAGYYGKDRVEATVAVGKDIVRVVYNFVIQRKYIERLQPAEDRKLCPKGLYWKISGASEEGDTLTGGRFDGMNALLTTASQHLIFADLSGLSIGQTTGTGPSAQITLDTNAAGYGWYVDRQLLNPWGAWTVDVADGAALTPSITPSPLAPLREGERLLGLAIQHLPCAFPHRARPLCLELRLTCLVAVR